MLPITHILKNMFHHRTRLLLTILAIAWGTFSIAFMLSVGEGLRLTFGSVANNSPEALIISAGASTHPFHGQPSHTAITFTAQDAAQLQRAFSNDAQISAMAEWQASLYHGKKTWRGPPTMAVHANYTQLHHLNLQPGSRFINQHDMTHHKQVIVLGYKVAQELFAPSENPIGQQILIQNKPFLVIGIQQKSLRLFSTNSMPDDYTSWVPYSTYQELTGENTYSKMSVAPLTHTPRDAAFLPTQIRRLLAYHYQLDPTDPGIITVMDLQEQKHKIDLFLYGIECMLGIMGGLTLIVAGVGIANVMYISVTRAIREIGICMAIGATTSIILLQYICEALLTTAIGGALGLALTQSLLLLIKQIPMDSKLLQYFGSPKPILSLNVVIIVILALGSIGLLAGLLPARKAAAIDPAEALRYE